MAAGRKLVHQVLFSLEDNSPPARQALVAGCRALLRDFPAVVYAAAGELADDISWSVSDRDYDVALLLVFPEKASQDAYQDSPQHERFIEQHSSNWKSVRSIDWYVDA
jgi:hypothetical protein